MQSEGQDQPQVGAEQRFAFRFRKERERRGLTQNEVARRLERLGVRMDGSAVTRLENGQRGIKLDEATALSMVVDRPLVELMGPDFSPREMLARGAVRMEEDCEIAEISADAARQLVLAYVTDSEVAGNFSRPHADEALARLLRGETQLLYALKSAQAARQALVDAGAMAEVNTEATPHG